MLEKAIVLALASFRPRSDESIAVVCMLILLAFLSITICLLSRG